MNIKNKDLIIIKKALEVDIKAKEVSLNLSVPSRLPKELEKDFEELLKRVDKDTINTAIEHEKFLIERIEKHLNQVCKVVKVKRHRRKQ